MSSSANLPDRLLLWVDSVGGYLVCTADEVVLGQPVAEGGPDIAIMADLSRRHAVIRRQGGNYSIEAVRRVCVNGQPVTASAPSGMEA